MVEKKSGGGSKLARSEVVTIRLDPKLRFAAELAARRQRRTVSSFIEWALERATNEVLLEPESDPDKGIKQTSAYEFMEDSWDVDESVRFVRFASEWPALLNSGEEVLWKLIREHYGLGHRYQLYRDPMASPRKIKSALEHLSANWELFQQVAKGEKDKDALPAWRAKRGK